jgi:PAS domain S-box-containing protein
MQRAPEPSGNVDRTPGARGPEVLFTLEPDGILGFVHEAVEALTGVPAASYVGRALDAIVHEDDRIRARAMLAEASEGRVPAPIDLRWGAPSGRAPTLEVLLVPFVSRGRVVGIAGIARDPGRRKRRDRQLAAVQDIAHVGVWEWDVATGEVAWSDELYRIYGLPLGERITLDAFLARVVPEDRERVQAGVSRALERGGGFGYSERILRPDGTARTLETLGEAVRDASGNVVGLVGTCRDVTEERKRERERMRAEALKEGERRVLEQVASRAPLAATLETIVGVMEEQADGMLCSIQLLDPDGLHIRHGAAPSLPHSYNEAIDGRPIGADAGSCGSAAYLREPVVAADIASDPRWRDYRELAAAHGLAACWSTPVLSADGAVVGTFAMYYREPRSPTPEDQRLIDSAVQLARIAIERQRDEDEIRRHALMVTQYQKMDVVGQLAGGIAHDFNNLLSVIAGYGELLRRQLDAEPAACARLEQILKATEHGASLTRQLLTFSRGQVVETKLVDVNAVVGGMDQMLRRLISEDIVLETDLEQGLGAVRADPGQLEQVIMNLVINARDALPPGGSVTIRTGEVSIEQGDARLAPDGRPGPHVMLEVLDDGEGMDPQTLAHVFEPFFSTKPKGKGTGLGLAVVYGIVRQGGGHIAISSEPGRGTSVRVYLPRVEGSYGTTPSAPVEPHPPRRGVETILLVEDNDAVRALTHEMLEENGYTVLAAQDAEQALELSQAHREAIHLMLTDVVMPGMSGPELAARLRSTRPAMRVVYASGYVDWKLAEFDLGGDDVNILQKPFTQDTLLLKIQDVLDRPPAGS